MKGFMTRDLGLMALNLRFYLAFIVIMGVVMTFSTSVFGFLNLYVMVFAASSLLGVFSYDEAGHWQSYAAAVPDGRRQQVAGRYGAALAVWALITAVQTVMGLLAKEGVAGSLLYSGMFLLYVAFLLPLSYHFGTRSRLVMIVIIGVIAGLVAVAGTTLTLAGGVGGAGIPLFAAPALLALGGAALAVSYRISLKIMGKKEL